MCYIKIFSQSLKEIPTRYSSWNIFYEVFSTLKIEINILKLWILTFFCTFKAFCTGAAGAFPPLGVFFADCAGFLDLLIAGFAAGLAAGFAAGLVVVALAAGFAAAGLAAAGFFAAGLVTFAEEVEAAVAGFFSVFFSAGFLSPDLAPVTKIHQEMH